MTKQQEYSEREKDIDWKWFVYGVVFGTIATVVLVVAATKDIIVYGCAP